MATLAGESTPIIQDLERARAKDAARFRSLAARDMQDVLAYLSAVRRVDVSRTAPVAMRGAVIDGLSVSPQATPAMSVQVNTGMAMVPNGGATSPIGSPQTSEASKYVMMNFRTALAALAINTQASGSYRFDLIEIAPLDQVDDSEVIEIYDEPSDSFIPTGTAQTTMQHGDAQVFLTQGTVDTGIPTPTAGRIPIAAIRVANGATSIKSDDVIDLRVMLSELAAVGPGAPKAEQYTSQLSVDVPTSGLSITSPQPMAVHTCGQVYGVPFAVHSDVELETRRAVGGPLYFDKATLALIDGGTNPQWLYCYVVTTTSQGLRLSHGIYAGDTFAGLTGYSHTGVLIWSHIAPKLTDGSLAPSGNVTLPDVFGGGIAGPGVGSALCIGVGNYTTLSRWSGAFRLSGGKGEFSKSTGYALVVVGGNPAGLTFTAEGTGTVTNSIVRGFFDTAANGNPCGATHWDVYATFMAHNATESGARRILEVFSMQDDGTPDKILGVMDQVVYEAAAGDQRINVLCPDLPVARDPSKRGTPGGFYARADVFYSTSTTGSGLKDPTLSLAAPALNVVGYRWAVGPCMA